MDKQLPIGNRNVQLLEDCWNKYVYWTMQPGIFCPKWTLPQVITLTQLVLLAFCDVLRVLRQERWSHLPLLSGKMASGRRRLWDSATSILLLNTGSITAMGRNTSFEWLTRRSWISWQVQLLCWRDERIQEKHTNKCWRGGWNPELPPRWVRGSSLLSGVCP